MNNVRIAVVGAGAFGRNHIRILKELPGVDFAGAVDPSPDRRSEVGAQFGVPTFETLAHVPGRIDAAVVATPTTAHASVGCELLQAGVDVLVEKPIAATVAEALALVEAARRRGRILQVGHLERFNPAVQAVRAALDLPLFFEIHRMSLFTPRSLDVDVVLDLMIHDVDILLSMTGSLPSEIRAAGIRILSPKVDIANVRLAFPNGCIANLTASRVSTEKIRKLRLFQPGQYISLDYARQEVARFSVSPELAPDSLRLSVPGTADRSITFDSLPVEKQEPLRLELASFLESVRARSAPVVTGEDATRALEVCLSILDKIEEHGRVVTETLRSHAATASPPVTS
jgi:predicted dehydrogenase